MTDFAANFLKMIQPGVARRDSAIALARKEFDRNGDGAISKGEFQRVFAAVQLQDGPQAAGGCGAGDVGVQAFWLNPESEHR